VAVTPSGHTRAHACPHGLVCEPGFKGRFAKSKDRTARCAECAKMRAARAQLGLFS
jgi:hypothetical protein